MSDQIEVLKLVTGRLYAAGIGYMVTGSLALSHYAQPRMTRDIDLVVALEPNDAERLAHLLGDQFECDAGAMRAAIVRQGLFNLIYTERVVKVDFVVRKDTPFPLRGVLAPAMHRLRGRTNLDGQPGGSPAVEARVGKGYALADPTR